MPKRKKPPVLELYSIIFFYTRMEFSCHKPNMTCLKENIKKLQDVEYRVAKTQGSFAENDL